jgi:hypothetical protein
LDKVFEKDSSGEGQDLEWKLGKIYFLLYDLWVEANMKGEICGYPYS